MCCCLRSPSRQARLLISKMPLLGISFTKQGSEAAPPTVRFAGKHPAAAQLRQFHGMAVADNSNRCCCVQEISADVVIIGGGPAAHAAAVYLGRAELEPILFEGW